MNKATIIILSIFIQGCLIDVHGPRRPDPPPVVYDVCYADWDCPVGQYCEVDGYCRMDEVFLHCHIDRDCPFNYYCAMNDLCYEYIHNDRQCFTLSDCPTDYYCARDGYCHLSHY